MHGREQPTPFLKHRVHRVSSAPGLTGLCVGYENGAWRCDLLAKHAFEWLPEFALRSSEAKDIGSHNCVEQMRKAALKVYASEKFSNRGEFGELFLHIAIRQVFNSMPAISKIYYKSARNDTVKGFDAVHVVPEEGSFELWLGEAKFYKDSASAIRDVAAELVDHTDCDYLKDEFILIADKLDDTDEFADELRTLLSRNTSVDEVFSRVCIPVFLTYDSECISKHSELCDSYGTDFANEVEQVYRSFSSRDLPASVQIQLFLMPLDSKVELVKALDQNLRMWQEL